MSEDCKMYLGNLHKRQPSCTQFLYLIQGPVLYPQQCLQLLLGPHLFSLSQPIGKLSLGTTEQKLSKRNKPMINKSSSKYFKVHMFQS